MLIGKAWLHWAFEAHHSTQPQEVIFKNELGNSIRLKVQEKPIDGVRSDNHHAVKGAPGILIELEGPSSLSENHITRMEAEQLYAQLGQVLGK